MPDPAALLDRDDPGDDTQLRFRYQHGYGVILLAGAGAGLLPYVAVWCEHHEDLLGEKPNGRFDSFQIKTAKPESAGPWKMNSEPLFRSVGRFVELDSKFPDKFDAHTFVSNCECYDTAQADELWKSPIQFFRAVQACAAVANLAPAFVKTVDHLAEKLTCDKAKLFETCKRVRIAQGPALNGFETAIAHEHLPKLDGCVTLAPAELNGLRDELIQMVWKASSVAIDDPGKHWCCVLGQDHLNPRLKAKRLTVKDTVHDAVAGRALVFRFTPSGESLTLGGGKRELAVLGKKLLRGGLVQQLDSMQSRTLSAEQHLLALVAQDADEADRVLAQVKGVVQGTCDDAQAVASATPEPWGLGMYRDVVTRLRNVSDTQPDMVCRQPHECLMGVAGLLTEACKVWWSPRFDVKEAV